MRRSLEYAGCNRCRYPLNAVNRSSPVTPGCIPIRSGSPPRPGCGRARRDRLYRPPVHRGPRLRGGRPREHREDRHPGRFPGERHAGCGAAAPKPRSVAPGPPGTGRPWQAGDHHGLRLGHRQGDGGRLARDGFDVGVTWHSDRGRAPRAPRVRSGRSDAAASCAARRDRLRGRPGRRVLAEELGGLDVFVNNAGGGKSHPFLEFPLEDLST